MKNYSIIDFCRSLIVANKGRYIWRKYNKIYNIQNRGDYFVLLSDVDAYNYIFFSYIEKCFEARKRVIILTTDKKIEKVATLFEKRNELIVCPISKNEADELISYYSFSMFYFRFFFISLDEPEERKCSHLIGKKGITAEELIAVGVMGLDGEKYIKSRHKLQKIDYKGNDSDIIKFLNSCEE